MKKVLSVLAIAAAVAVLGCATVYAATPGTLSYLFGRQESASREELYSEAESLPEDERDEFLAENGVGEEPYSEEAAAGYSYVEGLRHGASYRQGEDSERGQDVSGCGYLTGQQRGASCQK